MLRMSHRALIWTINTRFDRLLSDPHLALNTKTISNYILIYNSTLLEDLFCSFPNRPINVYVHAPQTTQYS